MSTELAKTEDFSAVETVLIKGDLAGLKPQERLSYYKKVCESLGLNYLTQPFEYLSFQGRLRLYAKRDCAEQLRKNYKVSVVIKVREKIEDVYFVIATASLPDGRIDESIGALSIGGLKGNDLANALMKCETKAKRRATLSICGLGWADETEIDTIEASAPITPHEESLQSETWLTGTLKQYFPAKDDDPHLLAILTDNGLMKLKTSSLPEGWLPANVRAQLNKPIMFQYYRKGRVEFLSHLELPEEVIGMGVEEASFNLEPPPGALA